MILADFITMLSTIKDQDAQVIIYNPVSEFSEPETVEYSPADETLDDDGNLIHRSTVYINTTR
jgi:hypothetical protein